MEKDFSIRVVGMEEAVDTCRRLNLMGYRRYSWSGPQDIEGTFVTLRGYFHLRPSDEPLVFCRAQRNGERVYGLHSTCAPGSYEMSYTEFVDSVAYNEE